MPSSRFEAAPEVVDGVGGACRGEAGDACSGEFELGTDGADQFHDVRGGQPEGFGPVGAGDIGGVQHIKVDMHVDPFRAGCPHRLDETGWGHVLDSQRADRQRVEAGLLAGVDVTRSDDHEAFR